MLYFGNDDTAEQLFKKEIKGRFNMNILGQAHWFLQMRIHHHADGCISFDQHHFLLNLLQQFCHNDAPTGQPKLRDTPAPPDYVFTIENQPTTSADHARICETYADLDFCSCLCMILYLAYSTCADILFIICKLAKACINPGIKDFDALYWLLSYLCKYPTYGIYFYPTATNSPVNKLLAANNVTYSDIIVFSNASWQDCPNTGHSTIGHLTFYQGGLIAANSGVPLPVAMSSAEAEYMATCAASMQATII